MATLKAKQKDLKAKGLGNKPRTSDSLTDEDIEKLYASKCLGIESPQAVINTLWLNSTIHFGLRGGKEQRELRWRCQTQANARRKRVFRILGGKAG